MNEKIPYTPLSTRLSGSARETELRLKNIFSGPKKRPPALFLALVFSACVLCGNLVSCQSAQAEETDAPDQSASVSVDTSSERPPEAWTPVELDARLLQHKESILDNPLAGFSEEDVALLTQRLPAADMPREAVNAYDALRGDYWEDMLLPVAADEAADVTLYFVVAKGKAPLSKSNALVPSMLQVRAADGIVLRCGDVASYFPLAWYGNHRDSSNPLLMVKDFDGDGQPEAAVALHTGYGTGVYEQKLYIFDLDTMTYSVPDYSAIPLEITASSDGHSARMTIGDREFTVDLTRLGKPFEGTAEVGNQVRFLREPDGQLLCCLDLDFGCDTVGYLAAARFPVVCEGGAYRLGPALWLGDIL